MRYRHTPTPRRAVRAILAAAALAAVAAGLAAPARAGTSDYPSTLYLGATASTAATTSAKLVASSAATIPASASAGNLTGTYGYVYTVVDPVAGESPPSPPSNTPSVTSKQMTVTLPADAVGKHIRLYRVRGTSYYYLIDDFTPSSTTYTDNVADAGLSTVLPQAQNRIRQLGFGGADCAVNAGFNTCGYLDLQPGVYATQPSGDSNPPTSAATTPTGRGWIVDGPGRVSFPTDVWHFTVGTKAQYAGSWMGVPATARIAVGVWKVTTSGGAIASSTLLLDPNTAESSTNIIMGGTTTSTIDATISSFSLAPDEHLYVQFFRHQVHSYPPAASNTNSRIVTLFYADGVGRVGLPTANAFPSAPTLASPADGSGSTPTALTATFNDPEPGDTGTVEFRICTSAAAAGTQCSGLVSAGTSASVANGAAASWSVPAGLVSGTTYYWQARSQDALGGDSDWTATRSFTASSGGSAGSTTSDGTYTTAPVLTAAYSGTGDGTVDFNVCTGAQSAGTTCATPVTTSTATVTSGSTATWAVLAGLTHGTTYYWQSRTTDSLAVTTPWTATNSFTLDAPPADATATGLADGSFASPPQLGATYSDPDGDAGSVDFRVCTDAAGAGSACSGVVTSTSVAATSGATATWTVSSGLTHGVTYYWQARARDAYGAVSAWTATRSFIVEAPPSLTPAGAGDGAITGAPQLVGVYSDPDGDAGTIDFRICTSSAGAGTSCAGLVASTSVAVANGATGIWTAGSGLLHGATYHWQARARDALGLATDWTATRRFVLDAAPTAAAATPADGAYVATAELTATFSDADDGRGMLLFRICTEPAGDGECAGLVGSGTVEAGSGGSAAWSAPMLADGAYYWQVRAQDPFGAQSPWTATQKVVLDTAAPAAPGGFAGDVVGDGLRLTWSPPDGDVLDGYVLFVDGSQRRTLSADVTSTTIEGFAPGDASTFTILAVDAAGNVGSFSTALVGVPALIGLSVDKARRVLAARGLVVAKRVAAVDGLIWGQVPAAPAVVERGATIGITVAPRSGVPGRGERGTDEAPGLLSVSSRAAACGPKRLVRLDIDVSHRAKLAATLLSAGGKPLWKRQLGTFAVDDDGANIRLPRTIPRGRRYFLVVTARGGGEADRAIVRVTLPKDARGAGCRVG